MTNKINFAQPEIGHAEILIRNMSGIQGSITVKVYPIGAVFSGWDFQRDLNHKYSLGRCIDNEICHWPVKDSLVFQFIISCVPQSQIMS